MQRRGQCKFYAQGTCLKGESCDFAHNMMMVPRKKACMYYQRGTCTFGSRCRFQHVKSTWLESSASFSSHARDPTTPNPSSVCKSSGASTIREVQNPNVSAAFSGLSKATVPSVNLDAYVGHSTESRGNDRVICLLAANGNCPRGERCSDIHGDLCSTCGKYCMHPLKPEDRDKHAKECEEKQALECSQEIECSVCLERVLSKATEAERKFGLLAECDHAFCIACIKKWRSSSSSSGTDVNGASRACPVCRKLSYYVIPSPIWYSSKEEKQEIISKYKAKLKSIDCRYFNFGNGYCRFGRSCFYKHEVKPGSSWHNRSSNANYRCNNRRHRSRWDDDPLGFDEFVDMADLDAMLEMFEELYLPSVEAMGDGAGNSSPEDAISEPLELLDVFMKLEELEMKYSGDYDEEDFLEPWQKEFMYAQLGYDMDEYEYYSDEYSSYKNEHV